MVKRLLTLLCVFIMQQSAPAADDLISHRLAVTVQPDAHFISAVDSMLVPGPGKDGTLTFLLHGNLTVTGVSTEGEPLAHRHTRHTGPAADRGMDQEDHSSGTSFFLNRHEISLPGKVRFPLMLVISYEGAINHPIQQISEEYARGFSQTPGLIEERGVYLAGSTGWVPAVNDDLFTFTLTASLPVPWDAVSQGTRTLHTLKGGRRISRWEEPDPAEEVFLIAAPFHEYSRKAGRVDVMAFLRTPDEHLAATYLETTDQYLRMYEQLVGPYPFTKFALVENFWQTGYGMPSFTLLGDQIIRFPFILHSSYPHELLHNWWGNSAYVDFSGGNWCEGITVYLADHLIQEQRGAGEAYRRTTLQGYTDYVNEDNDFPVSEFISRSDDASSAIGYGKSMMTFHMLRRRIGDERFLEAVRRFYRDNAFRASSFRQIQEAFESAAGEDLSLFFDQWVGRKGAPELELSGTDVSGSGGDYTVSFTLNQVQRGHIYDLEVPVVLTGKEGSDVLTVPLRSRGRRIVLQRDHRPGRIDIDPSFDLFRRLHFEEVPPSFSKIFGAEKVLILLPSAAGPAMLGAYRELAMSWAAGRSESIEIITDDEISELPDDAAVWIFGKENLFFHVIKDGLNDYEAGIGADNVRFGARRLSWDNNSFTVAVRHPHNPLTVAAWLHADAAAALAGLGRKLPHYGKYSYLAFEGTEPDNTAKGQWPAVNSPLTAYVPDENGETDRSLSPVLPERAALAGPPPVFSESALHDHVLKLASPALEGRMPGTPGADKAADYIAAAFKEAGLVPGGDDGSWFQTWTDTVGPDGRPALLKNVIGLLPAAGEDRAAEAVVVCAHYDHLGRGWPDVHAGDEGIIHPGADDNASGTAVLIELARLLADGPAPQRPVLFAAFTAEECGLRGSKHFVANLPPKKVMAALNLDTVGRLGQNNLLVLNSSSAAEWKFMFMGVGHVTGIGNELVSSPMAASDQASFIAAGIPAVQFFSGAHADYHRPSDTADRIDAAGMVKTAVFVKETLQYLTGRKEPLTFMGPANYPSGRQAPAASGGRSASTGTMPDFTYQGKGVRIGSVAPGSAADQAGLEKGDILVGLAGETIEDLQGYSALLKTKQPGDRVQVEYLRQGKKQTAELRLQAR